MKRKLKKNLLGIYDLILSFGAIYIGVMMISSSSGIFIEYPKEWLSILPFKSWVVPGIIAIIVFGLGNLVSAIFSFGKESNMQWLMSAVMGWIFLIGTIVQVIILGEWYMATVQFLVFSVIQLGLSANVFLDCRKINKVRDT